MKVKNKERLYKYIFILRYIPFIKYETSLKDKELKQIIEALNIKNRYKRIKYVVENTANYIDDYYKDCSLCDFKNNKCICHRTIKKDYQNGCCRKCIYQSSKGCTTKNVACKLYVCSHAIINKEKLKLEDIKLVKLLNFYQRYILKNDYFSTLKQITIDLYVGPICLLLRVLIRHINNFILRGAR